MNKTPSKSITSAFFKGAARLVDLFGYTDRNRFRKYYFTNDSDALRHDWKTVGLDMYTAYTQYEQSQTKKTKN